MAKRCRFVAPEVVRIQLADDAQRTYDALIAADAAETDDTKKLTPEQLARAQRRVEQAKADQDWIDVKKELTAGEERRVFADLVTDMHYGERAKLDPHKVGKTRVVQYLIGWSFADGQGKSVPVSEAALDNLDAESYAEIVVAIDRHAERVQTEREARKNAPATVSA